MQYQRSETIECDLVGRYVTVAMPAGGYLTLCEVEAYSSLSTMDAGDEIVEPGEFGLVHFGDDSENILLGKAAS